MAVLQATTITGGLTMHGMAAGFMKINAEGAVVMDTNTYLASGSYLALSGGTMTGDLRFNQGSGYGRIAFLDNYHGMILRGIPNNAAGDVTVGDYTSLIQHSGDFRFYRTNGSINELYFQVNASAAYWRGNTIWHSGNLTNLNQLSNGPGYITSSALSSYLPLSGGTMTGNITMNSKIVIQDGTDGGGSRGIWMWTAGDSNWGIYMGTAGASKSLSNGTASTGIDGSSSHHIRFRIAGSSGNGFIWENNSEQALMSLRGDNGNLYARGQIYAGNNTSNLVLHAGNYSSYAVARYLTTQTGTNPVKIWNGHLASFSANSSGNTYTIIQTSVPQDNYQMGGFTLEFFNNYSSTNGKTQIDIAGYWNPEGNGGFIGFEYHTSNPFVTPNIQVARNSSTGNVAFIITNNNVSYQVVVARDLWLGYNSSSDSAWGTGWSIYETSSIAGFTNADSVIARVAAGSDGTNASGTWGINITGNSATTSQTNFSNLTIGGAQVWYNSGGWLGDLASYGFTRAYGIQMSGGAEFVLLYKGGQGYTLVDGSYYAYEAGGFYSSSNSAGNTLLGFYADTTSSVNFNTSTVKANGNTILHAGNYNSYSPTLTGGGASGTWGISITGNADTTDGLHVHSGRNNEADKIVRTDGNGYIQAGWINTTSGSVASSTAPARIYASDDGYIRYYSLEDFKVALGLPRNSYNRSISYSGTVGYHTGSMGHGSGYDVFNALPHFGSGFIDFWSGAPNAPDGDHWVGIQSWHAVNWNGVAGRNYGWQLVHKGGTQGDIRFHSQWADTDYGWISLITSANIGSQSVSYATSAGSASSASSVPWSGVSAGYRTNYDLGFRPADNSSSYAGFRFATPGNDADAGYFLIRGGADADVYTQDGITLVADKGWLTLAQRTTASKGVRIMTGTTSVTRLQIDSSGNTDVGLGAGTVTLYHGGASRFWTGSDGTRTQGWSYFQNTSQGLHWPGNNWHLHPASASDFIIRSGSNTDSALRFDTNGTTRGYVYSENDNTLGFLTNTRNWALRVYSDANIVTYGHYLTVGQNKAWSSILMHDSDEGTREIHCNSNRIGFLNQSGNWGAWNDDNGNWGMSLNAYMAGNRFDIQGAEGQISFKDGDNVWTGYVGFTGNLGYLSFPGRNVKINSGYNGTITLETGVSGYNTGVVSIPYGRLTVDNSYIYAGTYVEAGSDMRAPIYYDSANTAYYGDFASTSRLNVLDANSIYTSGGLSTNGGNSLLGVQSPGGASRANGGSTETGAFKITLPSGIPVYGMFKLVIHIYEYGQRGNGYEIHCGGHMYPNYMYNRFQVQYGTANAPLNVRYGNDGTNGCIWIGNTDTTWSYPQIWVSEFMMGYSNTSWTTWRSGWSISLVTSYGNSGAMDGPYTCDYGYAASAGSASTSSQVTINYNDNSNANYQLLWGSGNNVYGTGGVYVNPADDRVYANYFSSAYYMDVYTSAGSDYLRITDNQVYRPNGGILYLNWSSNANVALTGPSGGNVGVGNNSPSYKMHVSGDIYANGGWLRVSGSSGLYFESYGGGWRMTNSSYVEMYNGKSLNMNYGSVDYVGSLYLESGGQGVHLQPNSGSYGSLQLTGSRGGWHGIRFTGSNVNLMVNTTEVGFHNNASGWQMRWESGTGYVHKGSTGGGTSATILDSSNFTSWAAPRNYLDGLSVGFHVYGDANTYYPVLISAHGHFGMHRYSISRSYADTAPWDPIGTGSHKGGLTLTFDWSSDIAWGGNDKSYRIIQFAETYTNMVAGMALPVTGGMLVWLRGGGAGGAFYRLHTPGGLTASATAYMSGYTGANGTVYPIRTDTSNVNSEIRSRFPVRDSGNSDLYVNNNIVWHQGNLTNLNQLSNGPGYITSSSLSSYLPLSGGTMSGNLYIQSGANPTQFNLRGTNPELYVDAAYGGGTGRIFINRQSTSNQASLHFTTGLSVSNGTAWNGSSGTPWTIGVTNNSGANDFKIAYGDTYDLVSVALRVDTNIATHIRKLYVGDTGGNWSDPGGWGSVLWVSNAPHAIIRVENRNDNRQAVVYSHQGQMPAAGSGGDYDFRLVRNYADRITLGSTNITMHTPVTINGQVYINRHIDANTTWGSCGCTSVFLGWGGSKVMLGNGNSGGHDYGNARGGNTIISTNPHYFYSNIEANSSIRFQEADDRRLYGASLGAGYNAVRVQGNWNTFDIMGRVLDWTGSNMHFGNGYNGEDHSAYYFVVGNPVSYFQVNGPIYATGDVVAYYSDRRLKQNIEPINSALDIIDKIGAYTFEWNKKSEEVWAKKEGDKDFGLISQEVEAVWPMGVAVQSGKDINDKYGYGDPNSEYYDPLHVEKNPEEYKTVRYDKMVTLAIAAIKEQQLLIESQQKQIDELKEQLKNR